MRQECHDSYHLHGLYSFRFPCRKRGLETDVAALQYAETERADGIPCAERSSIRERDRDTRIRVRNRRDGCIEDDL
jgi:hypothetical protein